MNNMKKYILPLLLLLSLKGIAQQEVMISQYMFNGLLINPAYSGSHPYWSTSVLHRSQWVKMDGAPKVQTVCADGSILKGLMGVGVTFTNDNIGLTTTQDLGLNTSTRVSLGSGYLRMGLRLGVSRYSARLNEAIVREDSDPVYANNIKGDVIPRVGAGLYYYTNKWYLGVSAPNILSVDDKISYTNTGVNSFYRTHLYANGGLVLTPNSEFAVKPSFLVKIQDGAGPQVDLNCNLLFLKKFWVGAGYRSQDAIVAMLEWNITPEMRLGYAFDYTLSDLAKYSNNSHEVMLGYDFGSEVVMKTRSPRYF